MLFGANTKLDMAHPAVALLLRLEADHHTEKACRLCAPATTPFHTETKEAAQKDRVFDDHEWVCLPVWLQRQRSSQRLQRPWARCGLSIVPQSTQAS
jgi:hypothetical protein